MLLNVVHLSPTKELQMPNIRSSGVMVVLSVTDALREKILYDLRAETAAASIIVSKPTNK